jgi:hypothetical protein
MKPLQNQYQDLLEGKMSKYNFLNNIKRSLPNLVSNITSFDDAVKILKNKRILSENIDNKLKEELKTVKEPNPNAGKYQILTHKNTPVTDKFFDTMDDATQFVRKQKYSFEIKIQKVSPERSVYKKVSENISNTVQMGGVTSSKGTAGYINNPDKKEETKALTTYKVGDQVKFTNGEVWKVTKPGVKGDKVFLAPFNDIAKKGHTSIAIEFTADELKDTLKENITSRLKPGNKYTYEGGAEEAILVYIGTSQDNPDIRVGSSMGKGHIFKWPDGKYFELGPMSVSKYISKSESSNEDEESYDDYLIKKHEDERDAINVLPGAKEYYNENIDMPGNLISDIDKINPIEYRNGLDYELNTTGDFSAQGLQKAVKKVIKNLKKDSIYYTNLKSNLSQKVNSKKAQSSEYTELKKDNQLDKHNQLKTLVKKEMANTKITQSKQEKATKTMPKGVKLMKEVKLEDVKSLLSNETLKNSNIGYGVGDSTGNEVSIKYKKYDELPFEDLLKLQDKYQVYKDVLSSEDEPVTVQYFISDKFKSSTPSKPNITKQAPDEDERIFETDDDKKRQKKDFEKFSAKMIGKPSTKQNTIKDKIKEYVVKQLKKEAVKFTIGSEKEYVSDTESRGFEDKLRRAGVTKFTKSKVQ